MMKSVLTFILSVALLVSSMPGTVAHVHEIGETAVYTNVDGERVASVNVMEVDYDFTGAQERDAPGDGGRHVAVSFEIENISSHTFVFMPARFRLVDSAGTRHHRAHVSTVDEAIDRFINDFDIAPGEKEHLTLVYEIPEDRSPAAIFWQPESTTYTLINLSVGNPEPGAVVCGLGGTAHLFDENDEIIASFTVAAIIPDWRDYDDLSAPADDHVYWAVQFIVGNNDVRSIVVSASDFQLVNDEGHWSFSTGLVRTVAGDQVFDRQSLVSGETRSDFLFFEMPIGTDPALMLWRYSDDTTAIVFFESCGTGESRIDGR